MLAVLVLPVMVVSWHIFPRPGSHGARARLPHQLGGRKAPTTRRISPTTSVITSPADQTYAIGDVSR
ncbi:MAG: hypothetical protein ACYCV7_08450, partial [Acidimicrobiales bacterium]